MIATRQVACHVYQGLPLFAPIEVEGLENGSTGVRCLKRDYLVRATPEEEVRQALLWFLSTGSTLAGGWTGVMSVEVERQSVDVATFLAGAGRPAFRPPFPVLAIETKRPGVDLSQCTDQIQRYMRLFEFRHGLLFNGEDAMWISRVGDAWISARLFDLAEVDARLADALTVASATATEHADAFEAARSGHFDALLHLARALGGGGAGLTFNIIADTNGRVGRMQAFNLKVLDDDTLGYLVRGVTSRTKPTLSRAGFRSLDSVVPL